MAKPHLYPLKIVLGSLWLALFLLALILWWRSPITLSTIPLRLEQGLQGFGLLKAALIYVAFYAVRPLILLPAIFLTVAAGLIFGPWLGILLTVVGENVSANIAFVLSRWFGRKSVSSHLTAMMRHWDEKFQQNGIVAVLTMRLLLLPFDAVNFGCGLTSIRQRDYALGTFFGLLPSLIGFVLLGGLAAAGVQHRIIVLVFSLFFIVLSFGIAHYLKHREARSKSS